MIKFENMYSKGKNDECYTPEYGVKPILKYVASDMKIWCPFDKDDSNFVKLLKYNGNIVHNTHIDMGQDFYEFTPDFDWDCIISNTWLNDSAPKKLFKYKELQLLMFEERMKFINPDGKVIGNSSTFSSSYYCYNFLPKQIVMDSLKDYM